MPSPAAIPDLIDDTPDDQLMLVYAGDDVRAFDVLYARHEGALYRFVRRLLGMRLAAEVDDVFQQTWMRIVSARDSFPPPGTDWRIAAFTIAHNLALDRLKSSGRAVAFYAHDEEGDGLEAAQLFSRGLLRDGDSGGDGDGDAAHPSADELAFWGAAGRRLLACLDELPDDQRAAFLWQYEDNFTVEAIASALEVDADTLRSRSRHGLNKLRDCMERYIQALPPSLEADDDLQDKCLNRALAHAPDQRAVPDWRLRKSISRKAHDAVGATDPVTDAADLERAARPRLPWKAALATVLVVVLAGVFWMRQPPSVPKLDVEVAKNEASPAPASALVTAPAQPKAAEPVPIPPPSAPAASPTEPPHAEPTPPDADIAARFAPVELPPARTRKELEEAAPARPAAPVVAPPDATAPVPARKAAPNVRTDETEPPTFEALATWNHLTIYRRGGGSRGLSRAEARELPALLGSATLSAVGPRPLGGTPEWRVTFERGGEVLAVLEIAGSQVRWREGRTPPATGVPSAPALGALREALQQTLQPPDAAVAPEPAEPPRSP